MTPLISVLLLFGLAAPKYAIANVAETVPLDDALIPGTFDDNDVVEFGVAGRFNSTCWQIAGYDRRVETQQQTIRLRQHATQTKEPCLRMLLPFAQVVNLGVLPAGRYQVVDADSGHGLGELRVDKASPPETRYAVVHEVSVSPKERAIRIRGEVGDRCSELEDILVTYGDGTILVEPRLKNHRLDCGTSDSPRIVNFDRTLQLRTNLEGGYLLQVRTRAGDPITKYVVFEP